MKTGYIRYILSILLTAGSIIPIYAQSSMILGEPVVQPGKHGIATQKRPHMNNYRPDTTFHKPETQQTTYNQTTQKPQTVQPVQVSNQTDKTISVPATAFPDTIRATDFSFYHKLANDGDTEAQRRVGICYLYGTGVDRDLKKGLDWIAKAAMNENTEAQYDLGVIFRDGYGVKVNLPDAAYWFRKAARNGNDKAQLSTGILFLEGKGVQQDYRIAAENFWRAAEQGNIDAAYRLACMYRDGIGMKKDLSKAYHYFRVAASKGEYKDAVRQAENLKSYAKPSRAKKAATTKRKRR